jgi:hypothetical protein
VLSRWVLRQDYRDASTRPSAAGVTGILDPRRARAAALPAGLTASGELSADAAGRGGLHGPDAPHWPRYSDPGRARRRAAAGCLDAWCPPRGSRSSLAGIELAYRNRGSAHNGTAIGDSGPGVAGLPPVAAAPPAACVPSAATDGPGILLRRWYSRAHSPARIAAAHYRCSKAGHQAGIDRGSPNHGSTLASKRVMAQIRSPARVST